MRDAIKNLLKNELTFLEELGFHYNEVVHPNFVDNTKQETKMVYELHGITISFKHYGTDFSNAINIFISKKSENKGFSFNDYLKSIGAGTNLLTPKNETESEYLLRMLNIFKTEAQTNLAKVLAGHEWLDVPSEYGR